MAVSIARKKRSAAPKGPSRSRAKRLASGDVIRQAAATLFLTQGYQGTSMDDIAAAAQVSKQTIYTHFSGKEDLFRDLVMGNAGRAEQYAASIKATVDGAPTLEDGLRELARGYLATVIRPEVLQLRRLVIGEAARFPDLARDYYQAVPQKVYDATTTLVSGLMRGKRLRRGDPAVVAQHLTWLMLGIPLDRAMFDPGEVPGAAELERVATAAVDAFLAAYAPR